MEEKAEQVIKRRKWEYIRDSLIAIAVIAVLVTGIVLAVKFLKGKQDSIILYNENGEAIGTYTQNSEITVPTKKGYSSIWVSESGQVYTSVESALANGEASVKQVFSPIQYTLTLYLTGGQLDEQVGYERHEAQEGQESLGAYYTRTFTIEDDVFELPAITNAALATKRGSNFGYWSNVNYIGSNYTADQLKSTEIKNVETSNARDIALYAVWKDIICTVNVYNHHNGVMFYENHNQYSILSEEDFTAKVLASAPAGFTFAGFYTDSRFSTPFDFTQEIEPKLVQIYTKWNAQSFTLEFKDVNGDTLLSTTYKTEEEIHFYDYPEIPGKTFDGWLLDNVLFESTKMPPKDIVLYPSLTNIPYSITWIVDDERQAIQTYYYGDEPQAPSTLNTDKAEDEGHTYVFDGWSPALTAVTDDATYAAQYRTVIKKFTYSIEVNGVEVTAPTTVDYETAIVFPSNPASYEKDGYYYTFSKWVIKGTNTTPTIVTKDMVIDAVFDSHICSYQVQWFDRNGDIIQVKDSTNTLVDYLTIEYGTVIDLDLAREYIDETYQEDLGGGHIRTYSIKGWTIGNIFQTSNSYRVVGNTEIHVKYEDDSDKSNYILLDENGVEITRDTYYVGEYAELYALIYGINRTKEADNTYTYTFAGWYYLDNNVETRVDSASQLDIPKDETITLYEKFNEVYIPYTITWNLDNDQGTLAVEYHYGDVLHPEADLIAYSKTTIKAPTQSTVYTFSGWKNYTEGDTVTKSTTYLALYDETVRHYTYTFKVGDDVVKTNTIDYNTTIIAPVNPTKARTAQYTYTFSHWETSDEVVFVDGDKIQDDVTYNAIFTPTVNQYTYTFKIEEADETPYASGTEDYGYAIHAPINPSKAETAQYTYTFDHWETLAGVAFVDGQELQGDIIFVAVFTPTTRQYTYTFYNGSAEFEKETVDYGSEITIASIGTPTKADDEDMYSYTFNGWYTNSNCTGSPLSEETIRIIQDIEYYAGYTKTPIEHTYTFKKLAADEEAYETITVGYGLAVTAPQNPTRDYYTFDGWDKVIPETMGTADDLFIATWTPIEYTITYVLDGGTNSENNPATYNVEDEFTLKNPEKLGYTFTGWDNDGEITLGSHGNKTFTASWEVINYTITYELNGGTNSTNNPATYTVEDAIALADPSKLGYDFGEWSNNGVITKGSTGNKTFTASWEVINYNITYVLNGGTNSNENPATYTIEQAITLADPSKPGYTFTEWSNGGEIELGSYGDITITATFEANTYTVTFNKVKEGAVLSTTSKEVTFDSQYGTLPTPTIHGYDFAGWYLDDQTQITNASSYTIVGNTTLTAKWTLHTYYVDCYVGSTKVTQYTFDIENPINLPSYTKNGEYEFGGWYLDDVTDESIAVSSFRAKNTFNDSDTSGDETINVYAIVKTTGLTIVGNTVTAYDNTKPYTNIIIPRVWDSIEVTTIAANVFKKNSTITSVETKFITTIGDQAFYRCTKLANIDLSSVETIGDQAFANCKALTSVDLSKAETIGEEAFSNSGLTTITLSKDIVSLGDYAFFGCNITTIHFDGTKAEFEAIINATEGNEHLLGLVE